MKTLIWLFALGGSTAWSAPLVLSASGTYNAATSTTAYFGPGKSWSLSFTVDSNPTVLRFQTGFFSTVQIRNVSYRLNGVEMYAGDNAINMYVPTSGLFSMCLDSGCSLGFTMGSVTPMYTGPESSPTLVPAVYNATGFDAYFFPPGSGTSTQSFQGTVPVTLSPVPVTTLSHVADGNGFDTEVLLINTGTADADYALQFLNQSGATVTYPLDPVRSPMTGTIHAGSQAIVRTAGSGSSTSLGWGQLTAVSSVKGMLIYQQQASLSSFQEGSAPLATPSQRFFFPFDNVNGATTSVGFVNPSSTAGASLAFTVRYESGGTDNVPVVALNPGQQVAETTIALWPGTAGKRGLIELNATSPIGLVAFRFQGSAFTLFDTIAATGGATTPVTSTIGHTADGNNFRSTFLLTNSGTVAASYTLRILDATGQPQTFGFTGPSPLTGTIAAGSTLTFDTTGLGSLTALGWAQLIAPPAVSGIEVFRQTNPGQSEQQATVPITQTNLAHFFLPFDNVGTTTSLALANPDPATTATVTVTFRYADGTTGSGPLTLAPLHYRADLLSGFFPAAASKAGVAEFQSNVPLSLVEVRFNQTQAFTSLRAVAP